MNALTKAASDVLAERQRQISAEGWDEGHDDHHYNGELAAAAACYASPHRAFKAVRSVGRGYELLTTYRDLWPWLDEWWKPKDRRADLVRAGALILAEIERLDRAATKAGVALPPPPTRRKAVRDGLRTDADQVAEESWRRRKGIMGAYWRAVSTYARHCAHAFSRATACGVKGPPDHG